MDVTVNRAFGAISNMIVGEATNVEIPFNVSFDSLDTRVLAFSEEWRGRKPFVDTMRAGSVRRERGFGS